MREWSVGSYLFMKITIIVTGGFTLVEIGYKYNYRNVLGFIATEGSRINKRDDPYLSRFPDIYSNVSVSPIVRLTF